MTTADLSDLASAARQHATHARADIANAQTRLEHIRLTGLAVEAEQLADRFDAVVDIYRKQE